MYTPNGKGLGLTARNVDHRNMDHLISDVAPVDESARAALKAARTGAFAASVSTTDRPKNIINWRRKWDSDQGDSPMCTAYSALNFLADGPVTHPGRPAPMMAPATLYAHIVAKDRAAGRYYTEGATMLAVALALRDLGLIKSFKWGYTLADMISGIALGPLLCGFDWLEGLFFPDRKYGVVRAFGPVWGGHAIEALNADIDDGMFTLNQTWGKSFGINGLIKLPFEDAEKLLGAGGEVLLLEETADGDA